MKTKIVAALIALIAIPSTWATDKGKCISSKGRAEILQVADLSQSVQMPLIGKSGQMEGVQSVSKTLFKVTMRGGDGLDFVLLLPERPAGKVVETSIDVCPTDTSTK